MASPVKKFSARGISVSVFENERKDGKTFLSANIERSYKDGEDWKTTSSFNSDDIPVVQTLSQQAFEYMLEHRSTEVAEGENGTQHLG